MLDVIGKRLSEPSTIADKFTDIGKTWALKLRDLDSQLEKKHAEKIINDIFYEVQLESLNCFCYVHIPPELHTNNYLPPFSSQQQFNSQQSLYTQSVQPVFNLTSPNTQPNIKPLLPNNQTATRIFQNFKDIM